MQENVTNGQTKRSKRDNGSGSIRQLSNGKYEARVMIGYNPNGNPHIKSFTAKTAAEAKRRMKEFLEEHGDCLGAGSHDYSKYSVEAYMTRWLKTVKYYELKPKSYDRIEQTMIKDIFPVLGSVDIGRLRAEHIQCLINQLADNDRAYSSIKKVYDCLNACFKLGVIREEIKKNPCVGVKIPKSTNFSKRQVPVYSEEEAKRIAATAVSRYGNDNPVFRLGEAYVLLLNTGLRLGELVALQWDRDINFEKRFLRVNSNVVLVSDRSEKAKTAFKRLEQNTAKTKAGTGRRIPLNDRALKALIALKKTSGKSPYVLTTKDGNPVSIRDVDKTFRRILVQAGFPEEKIYGVHALRHTFATLLLKSGVDIKVVSKILGHSDVTTTYNVYIHVLKEQEEEAMDSLPDIF